MAIFDTGKLWYSLPNRRYFSPCAHEIFAIASYINLKFGGILVKNTIVNLSLNPTVSIACYYDIVVIKDHPCVVLKCLGNGAFGKVYKAFDMRANRLVAVKSQPKIYEEKILKQVAMTRVNGIGLVDISSNLGPSFLSDGKGYFILPLADLSFEDWVLQKTVAGEDLMIVKAFVKIANDLIRLHDSGKVHMDLKIDNVLVVDNIAYISDFGESQPKGIYIGVAKAKHSNYPHAAPEYFSDVNSGSSYLVSPSFDLYSYGYLMSRVSDTVRKRNISQELKNISKYTHQFKVEDRKSLNDVIKYLNQVK